MVASTRTGIGAQVDRPRAGERQLLRLLHVVALGEGGGLERAVRSLCVGLRRHEHIVHLAAMADAQETVEAFQGPLLAAGVRVHPIILPARALLRIGRSLAHLPAQLLPDLVHTHGCWPDILAGRAARNAGVPTVTTWYGLSGGDWKTRLSERLQLALLGRFDAVAAASHTLAGQLANRVAAERLRVIPDAWLETDAPRGRAAARRALAVPGDHHQVIGWVGDLGRDKGIDLALRALALLTGLPATLVVVGDGPERAEYQRLAARLNVADRVHWCGRVPDAGRLFSAFDAFLLSSRRERTPLVLFEAMATRTPIVATAVGGVPDLLPRGTALLVRPEDPESLAHALRSVFDYPRHATARASAARTRLLTEYSPQRWIAGYETLYRQVSQRQP